MNSTRRLIVIVGLVVVAAIGFVVAKGLSSDSDRRSSTGTGAAPSAVATGAGQRTVPGAGTTAAAPPARRAEEAIPQIVVRGLEPVGGVKELVFRKGDTIRFTVVSDQPEEIHLHGYDVARDAAPGSPAAFALPAAIEGIFEVELEHAGVQIASIVVEP